MVNVKYSNVKKRLVAAALTPMLVLSACGEDTSSSSGELFNNSQDTDTSFNQVQLITSIVDDVITPTYQQFNTLANNQHQAVTAYCQQEQSFLDNNATENDVAESKLAAQNSWREAMNVWQQAEMMQVGPLVAGEGALRDAIYSWPIENTCGVDLDITYFKSDSVNGQSYDITKRTASRKSMVALEYLLFNDNLNHSCTGATVPGNWDNETDQYRKIARCEFAAEVANDVHNSSSELLAQWQGDSGYASKLKAAGTSGSDFATEHSAVNELSDALFYIDIFTKGAKLATPLGLTDNECGAQACPQAVESPYSQHSLENIINNLQALKLFIQGSGDNGLGFREYLVDVGDLITADGLDADIEQVLATTKAYQLSLSATLSQDSAQVEQTHTEVKNITDKLKSDFINSLALELPQTAAGDND